jgi:phage I-like protein
VNPNLSLDNCPSQTPGERRRRYDGGVSYRLVALGSKPVAAPSSEAVAPGSVPKSIQLLSWGEHETAKGIVILSMDAKQAFIDFQAGMNWGDVAGDFEHNTVTTSETYRGEPAKIAGNFKISLTADGLIADLINATPEGDDCVGNGHYRDISPTVVLDAQNRVIGLHSFAFCRKGAVKNLTLFSATFDPAAEAKKPVTERQQQGPQDAEELLTALRDITASKPDASPTQVLRNLLTKIETANPTNPNPPDKKPMTPEEIDQRIAAAINPVTAKLDALTAAITKMTGEGGALTELSSSIKALKDKQTEDERQFILLTASREGKVVPAETVKTLSNDQLRSLVTELPVTVPLSARTPHVLPLSAAPGSDPDAGYDPTIAKNLGLTKEAYKAAHQA